MTRSNLSAAVPPITSPIALDIFVTGKSVLFTGNVREATGLDFDGQGVHVEKELRDNPTKILFVANGGGVYYQRDSYTRSDTTFKPTEGWDPANDKYLEP